MFPIDAITFQHELQGAGSFTLSSSTRTILGLSIQQSGVASNSWIECRGTIIAYNYSKDFGFNPMNYVCNGALTLSKTGQDSASFLITYVPRNIASTSASTTQLFINGFSYGEVMTIMLLIFIFSAVFFSTLKNWIFGVKNDGIMKVISDKTRI